MSTRAKTYLIAAAAFLLFWLVGPLFVRNYEAFMEKRGWHQLGNQLWDYLSDGGLPNWVSVMVEYLPSDYWAGAFTVLAIWGIAEVFHAMRRRPDHADPKAQQMLMKEQRNLRELENRQKLREVARKLDDLYAEGVGFRNRVIPVQKDFNYAGERARLVEWSDRVVAVMDAGDISVRARSRFRTLDRWQPEWTRIWGKGGSQGHIEAMWNEKLKRLREIIDGMDA